MKETNNADGKIIKVNKLWWLKINKKIFRTTPVDGATYPYIVRIEYNVNDKKYEKSKFIYWGNEGVNVGDIVVVAYEQSNPSNVLKVIKKK